MSEPDVPVSWIARTAHGVVIARGGAGATELLVDRPGLRRFREPCRVEIHDGCPVVDGVQLAPVAELPADFAGRAGWYEDERRRMLLTQFPEPYFGEPMVLVNEGRAISRGYPVDPRHLLTDDGTVIELGDDRLRLTTDTGETTLRRSSRHREERVVFEAGGVQLAGTVLTPNRPGPHPAAVVLHAAAGGQRDFCRLHAAPLLDAGLAVLIYDKAGHGLSGGSPNPSIFDQADAAEAGVLLLASRPDVDPRRVGVAGFSNGMWAAPMVAARRPEVAFVAGIGAPGVSMAESEVHRRTKLLRDAGVGASTVAAVAEAWRCIFGIVAAGRADDSTTDRLDRALAEIHRAEDLGGYEIPQFARQNPMLSAIPPPVPTADLVAMLAAEHDTQLSYEPAADYARLGCPVLLQYGSGDTSVPVAASVSEIEGAVAAAGQESTVLVYPGLEHMLNLVPTDLVGLSGEDAMYQFHHFHFGPTVLSDLTGWLRSHLAGQPPESPGPASLGASA